MNPGDAELLAEIIDRSQRAQALSAFTPEAIADGHAPQLRLMKDDGRRVLALCSRRAGKSRGLLGLLALDAVRIPEIQIYFGATKATVRTFIWEAIWRPLCDEWKLPCEHNETRMVTKFAGGGVVAFTGTDDAKHVETYLGGRVWRAIIDESQSQPDSVLVPLVRRILPPALSDRGLKGQLILAGTIPEVPAGVFYRAWEHGKGWSKHNWSRFENPHMGTPEEQRAKMLEECESSEMEEDDPLIQREWYGKFVFTRDATAYRYIRERNGYHAILPPWVKDAFEDGTLLYAHPSRPGKGGEARFGVSASVPHKGIDRFAASTDPGTRDRWSFEVIGWGSETQEVQQVFEWSTPRKAFCSWGDVVPWMALVMHNLAPDDWVYDAGGSQAEIDAFQADYGIPVIRAANKADLPGQVRRSNELLIKSWAQIIIDSALEEDLLKARRDPKREPGASWRWASAWHPDPAESWRYAVGRYYSAYEPPEAPKPPEQVQRERYQLQRRRRAAALAGRRLEEDEENAAFDDADLWG